MIAVGELAPDFTLSDQAGRQVSLQDFKGEKNVVLYFYPRALTPGCTVQACGIRDNKNLFDAQDAVVLGVSPDPVKSLAKFVDKKDLNFTLLSDPEKNTINAYGAWGPKKFMGKSFQGVLRITFVIGKDGHIKHVMDKVKTKTHHQDVLQLLS